MIHSQVIYSRIAAVVRELAENVGRTARSRSLGEDRHYAVAALSGEGELVSQIQFDAGHVYLIRESTLALLDFFAFDLAEGDIVVVGDPYHGGSVPQVLTFVAPTFFEGEMVLFPAVRAELADLAGEFAGSLHPTAKETWQESIRVTPVKLYRNGVLQRDILRFLLRNSRAATLVRSDIEAIIAALQRTSRDLHSVLRDRGRQAVESAVAEASRHSLQYAQSFLGAWEGLDRTGSAVLQTGGEPLEIQLRLTVAGGRLQGDFSGTASTSDSPYNIISAHVRGYVMVAALAEALDGIAFNEGLLEAVSLTVPQGSLLNPSFPAATGLSDRFTGHQVAQLLWSLLYPHSPRIRIDGPSPTLVAFAPLGSAEETPPFTLDPGFALSGEGWSAPVLAGRRLLPSAEILETRDGFELLSRELTDEGEILVHLRNRRGDLEATSIVPQGPSGPLGSITIATDQGSESPRVLLGSRVPDQAHLWFRYPTYAGGKHE